ncbi:MAG: amino acid permease [Caulobacteraceae bacterium]|nr:amino acid permease [Caulobacteraceae bacterium]
MAFWNRRKAIDTLTHHREGHRLIPTLGWPSLIALGVGATVGTGIYTLIGVGAGLAGPGVILSFVIAGLVCIVSALAYAEMSTLMPAAGGAYTYTYAVLGELLAWIVGWSLILEYTLVCSAVAVGWSVHAAEFIHAAHWPIPEALMVGPYAGGIVNLPAVLITAAVGALLIVGTQESAVVNMVLVVIKLIALAIFITLAGSAFDISHFHPFLPYGFSERGPDGVKVGVMAAASIIFFAFYGFDTISTAAEETRDPGRNLTIGIIGSMVICIVIYMAVAGAAVGASPPSVFSKADAPLVFILDALHRPLAAKLVAGAAVLALPTVILAFMYGQSRIFFVMARDGLLPEGLSRVNPRTGTPVVMTIITAVFAAALAGLLTLKEIAEVANAGTLCAFIAVAVSMMVLRMREPNRPRVFKAPVWWLVGPLAIGGCLYLFSSLPTMTIIRFFAWNAIGLVIYLVFARRSSLLGREAELEA